MTPLPITPFQKHVNEWVNCKRCGLCKKRSKVVIARGDIPAEVLFVGEAPGESEDTLGQPFIGPAGKLLDQIIGRSMLMLEVSYTYCISNLVGCIPRDDYDNKLTEPSDESIETCSPRLQELARMVDPKVLVAVGGLARDWLEPGYKHSIQLHNLLERREDMIAETKYPRILFCDIIHPAAILRANISQRSLLVQRSVVSIVNSLLSVRGK